MKHTELEKDVLTTTAQRATVANMPSLSDFTESFPKEGSDGNYTQKSASDVYNLGGGFLLYSYNHDATNAYANACSIRGYRGLLYSDTCFEI